MRVPNVVCRRIVYPLKEAPFRRHTLATLRELQASERLSRDELLALQRRRLRRILAHAYEHVPYYRGVFDELGLRPEDVNAPEDLEQLPILTKEIIRTRRAELTATTPHRGYAQMQYTSGSTGQTVAIPADAYDFSHHFANKLRGRSWHGVQLGDPELRVTHNPRLYAAPTRRARAFWAASNLTDRFLNVHLLSGANLSEGELDRWEEVLRRARPRVIYGYAASIYFFACYLRDRGAPVPRVGTVLLTAEKVLPEQKEVIAHVFGAKVIEEYGSSELGVMAFECPHGGLHTSDETYVLEVAEPGPDGSGELLATSLVNEALPLIRYRVGDVVSRSDHLCTCGRPLGLLAEIAGRTTDYFLDDAGRVVHPFSLMLGVQRLEPLQRYRIVQIAPGRVELQFQGDHDLDERDSAAVHTLIRDVLGERTQVTVTRFDALPLGPRGKHRFLASEVANGRPA